MTQPSVSEPRTCRKCDQTKTVADFYKNSHCRDGYLYTCKECSAAYSRLRRPQAAGSSRRWREKNPGRAAQIAAEYRRRYPDRAKLSQQLSYQKHGARRGAEYRQRNPERVAESNKRYRERNRERRAAQTRAWRERNVDRVKAYREGYEAARKQSRPAKRRTRYAANPDQHRDRSRAWRKSNPDKVKVQKYQRRARKLGASGTHTAEERISLLEKQEYLCANPYCRIDLRTAVKCLDHVVALAKGGSNDIANMQWLCRPCNSRKTTLSQDEWLARESERSKLAA